MANFCIKCGKPLVDGKPCDCQQQVQQQEQLQEKAQTQQTVNQAKEVASKTTQKAKNIFVLIKDFIVRPADGFCEMIKDENSKDGLILIIVEAVLSGAFVSFVADGIKKKLENSLTIPLIGDTLRLSTKEIFLGIFVASIITSLLMSLVFYLLLNKKEKIEISWYQSCQIIGTKCIGMSMGLVLAFIFLILGMYTWGIVALLLGGILGYIYLISSMICYPGVSKNAIIYIGLFTIIVGIVVFSYVLKKEIAPYIAPHIGKISDLIKNIIGEIL